MLVLILVYTYLQHQLDENIQLQQKQIVAETKSLLGYFDYSMRTHEQVFIDRMRSLSEALISNELNQPNLENIDLFTLSKKYGLDTSIEHIYIIDRSLSIVNTTFKPDLGLNFLAIDSSFSAFFNKMFRENDFHEDRFGEEMKTGKIKKYSFLTTKNKKYILELGFYSRQADEYKKMLLSNISKMSHRYPGIASVELYLGVKGIKDKWMKSEYGDDYLNCLNNKKHIRAAYDNPATSYHEFADFIYLPARDTKLYNGYVLLIESTDILKQQLIYKLLLYFGLSFVLCLGSISGVVYYRAKRITSPLIELTELTKAVDTHNLDQHLKIRGSLEMIQLSEQFNSMMDKLKQSYEGLEEKVRDRTAELEEQKLIVEHKNSEIIDSIEYAKLIQRALLPDLKTFNTHFPKSFIYYQPKDIVAGDFYWMEEKNDAVWFAVGDCTGHGVPGAMVSVMCINALNTALETKNPSTTGQLLDAVRELVVNTFQKAGQNVKDGMDISLIRYDKKEHSIQWSGANNPLWIFNQEECEVITADKQPIGAYDDAKPFTTHTLEHIAGKSIVLFTDGYADQFGGPKNKKFKYATFKALLQENIEQQPEIQLERIKKTFLEWKGLNEQTDDVCLSVLQF